ncbi:SDR family oxidoreductase [Aurantiacibacter zhengii]|uniref:SDR family oxidoreductase n=1 Tax=Aurantiacibacter zhengii TaxID=2307003 RepID=UPI0013143066|nr:SDR family NAD(P)-dependent oxidoreductase [Aurantiacibacter zhengii]
MTHSTNKRQGEVALVTGATTGIGEAVAYALADLGLSVIVSGRRIDRLEAVAETIRTKGVDAHVMACDIADASALEAMFADIRSKVGKLDILVNNAGMGYQSDIGDFETAELSLALAVNVTGAAICIRESIALMEHRPGTAIITVSSMAAHRVPPGGFGIYSATKHALRAIMEALRMECVKLSSPTKIASISPGTVATEFHKLFARSDKDPTEKLPFERLTPEDVARAVTFVLEAPAHVQLNEIMIRPIGQLG